MANPQYLRLQPSKAVVAQMAATIFAGFVQHGQLRDDNEGDLVERSVTLAIKLANRAEALVTSDEEFTRKDTGSSFLVG
jgi:hypothetical protein